MKFHIYRLRFSAPLHLSRGRLAYDRGQQTLHSDTLSAALFTCALELGLSSERAEVIMRQTLLSSAYPFYHEEYFFPKPLLRLPSLANTIEEQQGKAIKRISFLGKSYFERLLRADLQPIPNTHLIQNGTFISDHSKLTINPSIQLFTTTVRQRVTISLDHSEDPTPFYTERIFFAEGGGLYFLVQYQNEEVQSDFEAALRLLGDSGIGTDRNVGNGFFEVETDTLSLRIPENATHQMALSLYCPRPEEVSSEGLTDANWTLLRRGGYIAGASDESQRNLRKRSVYMFGPGSVFPVRPNRTGKVVDLRPDTPLIDHPVWRNGKGLFVPTLKPPSL